MPLNEKQINNLYDAIQKYDYPAQLWDFSRKKPIYFETMRELESYLKERLISGLHSEVKYSLANIVYWGNINAGYACRRVQIFLNKVTENQIQEATKLFLNISSNACNSLEQIKKLKLPQFTNISFISKLRMFLDPHNYVVLDRKLLKLKETNISTIFDDVKEQPTYIPITRQNCKIYEKWCRLCRDTAKLHFRNRSIITVDVERGIFYLIDKGKCNLAANIVANMP